ncbi:MAG: hypothetical protein ACREQ9_10880, partial [Candidatus Binatia bacterium]
VYDQVKNKLGFAFDDLGRRELKNIREPIRVYRLRAETNVATSLRGGLVAGLRRRRKAALVIGAGLAVLAAVVVLRPSANPPESTAGARLLPPADRPSIAVLPFANLSGDPEQEYFSDGTTQDLTTEDAIVRAQEMFRAAIDLDAGYARAYSALGWALLNEWCFGWSSDPRLLDEGLDLGREAVALDDLTPQAHAVLAWAYLLNRRHGEALAEAERAVALDPNVASVQLAELLGPQEESRRHS